MKKALIFGITGQDGSYLSELLLEKGYEVYGFMRRTREGTKNIDHIKSQIKFVYGDLADNFSICSAVEAIKPDEVYNLAAQSAPALSFNQPFYTTDIVGLGAHRIFEAVKLFSPEAKVYQASSSEMYGWVKEIPQNEKTPFNPANPYAVAKVYAHQMARIYRKQGVFVSCGILFNHESPRRGIEFITQKLAYASACAGLGIRNSEAINEAGEPIFQDGKVSIGNLEAGRDWGFAGDYVLAMWQMLQKDTPDDFVIGTGEVKTVKQLAMKAFSVVGLDYQNYIKVDERFVRPTETGPLVADSTKAREQLGWEPITSFEQLVEMMVKYNLAKLK